MTRLTVPDFDLTDGELRRAGTIKWSWPAPDVLPAWVAEMDVRPAPVIREALHETVEAGGLGYPPTAEGTELPEATSEFLGRRFGWPVDPVRVVLCGDVMAGVIIALRALCEPAPVIVPTPSYPPFLDAVLHFGQRLVTVPFTTDAGRPVLDIERIGAELAAGARTVLLASPFNPLGRVFDTGELLALRDVVVRHGARVISDEIHAPLVLPGARHRPYAALEGTAGHTTTVFAATKAWNVPGLKCAQIIPGTAHDLAALRALPLVLNHGTSPLGIVASIAAYRHGLGWLDGLVEHLAGRREQLTDLLAEHLPKVTMTPLEATYLAWLDARATGLDDPAAAALERGRVMVNPGRTFTVPDDRSYDGFVRLNLATSAERLERIVRGLAAAWT